MTALIAVPLVGSAGMALDLVRAYEVKLNAQTVLDSATLAAAAYRAAKGTFDTSVGKRLFDGQGKDLSVTSLDFTVNPDETITGDASIKVYTSFMQIFGYDTLGFKISSTASAVSEGKLDKVSLSIHQAKGAFSKDIYFFTRDRGGRILSEQLVLTYRYDGARSTLTPPTTSSITFNVGDYASYGYAMVVYEDRSYKGRLVNPKKHYSDDADANRWIRKSGTCSDPKGIFNQWEDGGDWDYQDFQFYQACTSIKKIVSDVRLIQ